MNKIFLMILILLVRIADILRLCKYDLEENGFHSEEQLLTSIFQFMVYVNDTMTLRILRNIFLQSRFLEYLFNYSTSSLIMSYVILPAD